MHEHASGLPYAYDSVGERQDVQGVVFYGLRPYFQGRELNDLQAIERNRSRRLGRLVAREGNRIERADAVVDIDANSVILESGSIYVAGDVFPVNAEVLTGIPMAGLVEIGVRLTRSYITHLEDPSLVGLVPGSDAEGEEGAAREIASIEWAWEGDEGAGEFYPVYTLQDGTILDQTGPSILDPAMQALAAYDRPNGNYIVSGNRVTALGADAGFQVFAIEEGEANINGFKRTRFAALRHAEPEQWEELAIPGETHIYPGGASHTFKVNQGPIEIINSILLTKETTVTLTRGAIANGADAIPFDTVVSVSAVTQGGAPLSGWNLIAGNIDWEAPGSEPAAGSTYQVAFRYRDLVLPDASDDDYFTISGGAEGGEVIVAYTQKLPRVDRLGLKEDGSPIYIKGLPARSNPLPPSVPTDVLKLCQIRNDWRGTPSVRNDGTRYLSVEEQWRYNNLTIDLNRLVQLERIKSGIDSREPVAKRGMFVDPLTDDTYRDQGIPQSGAIGFGALQLAITPTFYTLDLDEPVMLDGVEEVVVAQELKTGCEKINPYANFNPLPGSLRLTPAVDFWTESRTDWTSAQTIEFNRGTRFDGGPLQTTNTENQVVDQRNELLSFLRQIEVSFNVSGFGGGEILESLTFDGIDVKPVGELVADAGGNVSGSFVIPTGVTAGTKIVRAVGAGETEATSMFVGQGTVAVDVMRRVTTVSNWTEAQLATFRRSGRTEGSQSGADPQAQMFAVPDMRQVVGVDFHICAIGNRSNHLLVDQVAIDNGYPTMDITAEAVLSMTDVAVGWVSARYNLPVTTPSDRRHGFVIKTDDNKHSISIAKLGGFDADLQKRVTSHPYVTGPRFSSVNAETWTAHQDEAAAFRVVANVYPTTTKTVDLGTYQLTRCSDLQVRAAVELPGPGCSVVFEVERANGTIYKLNPFQVLPLTEYLNEAVTLRAVLTGTNKLSPILFAPVELVAGEIEEEMTYVSRSFDLGENVRIAAYFKAFLPGGSTVRVEQAIDNGAWVPLPLDETEALAFPQWVELKHQQIGLTGNLARFKIIGTGGPAARLAVGDLGAGIF